MGTYSVNADDRFFNVRHYGVIPDGLTDNRQSLQLMIDAINARGGGTLFFPPGVYMLGIDPAKQYALHMRANIHLLGLHRSICTIRLANGQPFYRDIISHDYPDNADNVEITNLTWDHNRISNPVTITSLATNQARTIGLWSGRNIQIKRCRFTNFESMNNIMLSGEMSNLVVEGNIFDDVNGLLQEDHDYTAVYLKCFSTDWFAEGSGMWVRNNVFRSRAPSGFPLLNSRGQTGVTSAIETHGSNSFVTNNLIEDFQYGILATGERTNRTEQVTVKDNHIIRCRNGIQIWSKFAPELGFSKGPGMMECGVSGNNITVDLDAWNWNMQYGVGILVPPWNNAATRDLLVTGNSIRFIDHSLPIQIPKCNAFAAENSQPDQDKNWLVANNVFDNIPGSPIRIEPTIDNLILD